ncbi:hypothetical protein [Methylobacterium sp. J-067]|uniref:hypothetical protein n=1 Tax=Methylobacterium sp. J-067 TaxID=2836648 RepID=UPI001FBB0647|nr:hypothetical protein [Methylobacterium sp. J-067]MCJ2023415.1 hypothetical protein [Methylobacterium sp. J-067]
MTALTRMLAASGWGARCAFGLAGLAALAAVAMPAEEIPAVARAASIAAAPAEGSAVRRPPFDPERRPWTAQGSRDLILRPDPAVPVLVLRGLRLDGGQASAFIDDGSGAQGWLAAGEGRGDWHVVEIGPDRVSVLQRGRSFEAEFLGRPATLRPAPFEDAPAALRR